MKPYKYALLLLLAILVLVGGWIIAKIFYAIFGIWMFGFITGIFVSSVFHIKRNRKKNAATV